MNNKIAPYTIPLSIQHSKEKKLMENCQEVNYTNCCSFYYVSSEEEGHTTHATSSLLISKTKTEKNENRQKIFRSTIYNTPNLKREIHNMKGNDMHGLVLMQNVQMHKRRKEEREERRNDYYAQNNVRMHTIFFGLFWCAFVSSVWMCLFCGFLLKNEEKRKKNNFWIVYFRETMREYLIDLIFGSCFLVLFYYLLVCRRFKT